MPRLLTLAALALALAGCSFRSTPDPDLSAQDAAWMAMVPQAEFDPHFARYLVDDPTGAAPGTVVVETRERQLYFVLPDRKAVRYGVTCRRRGVRLDRLGPGLPQGVLAGLEPAAEMVRRWPHVHPMKGGPANPLGARALYLADGGGRDTLYRIHGTNEPERIGQAASSAASACATSTLSTSSTASRSTRR